MTQSTSLPKLPRVEDYRADLSPEEIAAAAAANTRSIAMQAYLFAFPAFLSMRQLTEFLQGRAYMAPNDYPLGGWFLMRKLADTTTTTVSPNVDTLYGATYLMLDKQGPTILSVPPIPDRYYSVALLDAYLNNFAIVSPRTYGNDGGDYLIVPPGWKGHKPEDVRDVLQSSTPLVCLFQRIYIRSEAEYDDLHRLQDAFTFRPFSPDGQETTFPPVDLSTYNIKGMRMTRDPLLYFKFTNFFTGLNPPPPGDCGLAALFQSVGVGPGSALPSDPGLRQAIALGATDAQAAMNARISAGPFRDGWTVPDPNIGREGPHFLSRATCQLTQLGAFPHEEAIYFYALRDSSNKRLNGANRYTLTFPAGQLPELNKHGFWSLTMYNESFLLVDNPINRYIIRPDTAGLTHGPDGSLTLYLQSDRPADAPAGNWLPAPQGDFSVVLRTYQPTQPIMDGSWFPQGIKRLA